MAIQYLLKEVKQLKALTEKQTKQIDLLTKIIFSKESLENINNNKKNEEIHIHEKELVVETCSTLNITYPVIKRKRKSAVLEVIHTPILGTYYFISSFNSSGVNIPIFKDDTLSDSINNTSKEDKIAIVDDFIEKKLVSRPNKQKDKSKSKKKDTRKNWSHEDIEIPNTASQMKTGPNCVPY